MSSVMTIDKRLPFWHFDNDLMVFDDGSLGIGFALAGIDITCMENGTINDFGQNLENFINTTNEGIKLQIFYYLENDAKHLVDNHINLSKGASDYYEEIRLARKRHFQEKNDSGGFFIPQIYLFVRSESYHYKKRGFWETKKRYSKITCEEYRAYRESFLRKVKQVGVSLDNLKMTPKVLSSTQWFSLLYRYFNLDRSKNIVTPILRDSFMPFSAPLVDQLFMTDLDIKKECLAIGNLMFRVISMKTLPESTNISMVDSLLKLPFHFWLSQNIFILGQKEEYDKLNAKRKMAHSMASGAKNISDLESESKLNHVENLISSLLESSEKIVSGSFDVIIWGSDENELTEKSDEVLNAFKTMNQSEGIAESYAGFDAFINAAPGVCKGLRHKKMKSSNLAHLMPLFAPWGGNNRALCLLSNRDQSPVAIDLFDFNLPNWNGLVIGSSGSGKSYTIGQLVLMYLGQKPMPKVVWIDNGASSKTIIDVLDGEFIDLNLESSICLNMFDLGPEAVEPSPSKIKLILGVLETILRENSESGLPKKEKALLEESIFTLYEHLKETPTLSDLKAHLAKHKNEKLRGYADILYSWTGNTPYGKLLDRPTNIKLNKNLVTVEVKGLDVYPELQNVFLLLLTDFIKQEAARSNGEQYLLILDEAWKLFETESGAAFAIEAYRTFRKFNAGIWSISQNINDFFSRPDMANAILQNTPSRIILKQSGVNWDEFKKTMGLVEEDIELIKSLKQVKGEYSEFYFIQNEAKTIIRLSSDPLSHWLCTSDPKDKNKIEELQMQNKNMATIDVLKKLAF